MRVRALSLLAAAALVSLCLYFALSARQVIYLRERERERIEEGLFPMLPFELPMPAPRPTTAPRTPAAPSPAPLAPPSTVPQVIDVANPVWLALPRHPERRYPREAFAADIEGVVELDCMVALDGRLTCIVASEAPPGWGFGEAALALSRDHIMAPLTYQGAPARGRYRMRIPFTQSGS